MRQFLCVALCLVASSSAEKIKIGDIETFHHGAGGEVFALDEKTLMIKDFTYDGAGMWEEILEKNIWHSAHFRPWCLFLGWSRGHSLQCPWWDQDQDPGPPLRGARLLRVQGPVRPHPEGRRQGADHPEAPREHEGRRHQVALRLVQEVQRGLWKPHLPHRPQRKAGCPHSHRLTHYPRLADNVAISGFIFLLTIFPPKPKTAICTVYINISVKW